MLFVSFCLLWNVKCYSLTAGTGQEDLSLSTWPHLWSTPVLSMCQCACSALCVSTTAQRRDDGAVTVFSHLRAAHSLKYTVLPSISPCLGPVYLFILRLLFYFHQYVTAQFWKIYTVNLLWLKKSHWWVLFAPFVCHLQSSGPVRNMVVAIVCVVLVLLHLVVGIIAHKMDCLDSLRLKQVPLCGAPGLYQYRVLVKTGWRRGSGEQDQRKPKFHCQRQICHMMEVINSDEIIFKAPQPMLA